MIYYFVYLVLIVAQNYTFFLNLTTKQHAFFLSIPEIASFIHIFILNLQHNNAMTYMGKLADFFTMTRRERIGTLVVTFLLAVAVGALIGVKSCVRSSSLPPEANTQIQEFK